MHRDSRRCMSDNFCRQFELFGQVVLFANPRPPKSFGALRPKHRIQSSNFNSYLSKLSLPELQLCLSKCAASAERPYTRRRHTIRPQAQIWLSTLLAVWCSSGAWVAFAGKCVWSKRKAWLGHIGLELVVFPCVC